jgi:tripartite ATP-independent transporter DctP family solute receptor
VTETRTAISRRRLIGAGVALASTLALPRGASGATRLRLAHGLPPSHPVHSAMTNLASLVQERSQGELTINVFADGVLGEEPALLDQVRTGTLDLTKVSATLLAPLAPEFQLFDIPFLFRDRHHGRRVLDGPLGQRLLDRTGPQMRGLCFYDAGARSFYGTKAIEVADDLAGLKVRVQPSPSTIRMIQLLKARPVPLPWGQVYTAFQAGLIDAAENNVTALTVGRHAEVVRHYAYSEHTIVPDVLLVSTRSWTALPPDHRELIRSAASESALLQTELWWMAEEASRAQAEALGVHFNAVDKRTFERQLAPFKDEARSRSELSELISTVDRI